MENDLARTKKNFLFTWVVSNAVGLGLAWVFGEFIGRRVAESSGWRIGQIVAIVVFESILWIFRGRVLLRYKSYKLLMPFALIFWIATELVGWVLSEAPLQAGVLLGITTGAILATSIGETMWLMLWFMTIPKRQSNFWAEQVFLLAILGMVGGSVLMAIFFAISLEVGEMLANMSSPILGMAIAGILFGGLLGAISGLSLIKLLHLNKGVI
jgi:MFS family permease